MRPERVRRGMFSPPYFSNSTNFKSEGIRKLLELLSDKLDKVAPNNALKSINLVEIRLTTPNYKEFEAQYIRGSGTLRIYLPRPGEINTPAMVMLADAASGDVDDNSLPASPAARSELVLSICKALGDRAISVARTLTDIVVPQTELRFCPRITKAERSRNSIPSVSYQIRLLEAEAIRTQSKLIRQKAKLAFLREDAGEED